MRPRKSLSRVALLGVLALVALTLMAIPGSATLAKKYDLTVTPSSIAAGTSSVFAAKYTNKSLYKIGSTVLTVPSGFQVTGATTSRGTIPAGGVTGTSVSVKDLNLSLGSSFTISVSATAPCGAGSGSWTAVTKTGNFSGSLFSYNNAASARTTTVTGSCNATIDVTKYADTDLSGDRGDGEPTLEGWEFTAHEGSSSEGSTIGSPQTTDDGGTTSFSLPIGGTYTICETPQDGWTNTDPGGSACETVGELTDEGASLQFGNAEGAGELGCPSTPDDPNSDTTGGEGDPSVILERGENAGGSECELVPYILRSGTEGETEFVEFIKDLDDQVSAQFVLEITWLPEDADYPLGRLTQVDYGDGPVNIDWCEPTTGGGRLYDLPPAVPGNPNLWCLVDQTAVAGQIAGKVAVTETLYGLGDPRVTRG
ncbi:MAG: hypothetical protein ACXWXN_07465 [Actinomycetota bacterium]